MKKLCLIFFIVITIAIGGVQAMKNTNGSETKVKLIVGSTTITATLNDSISARDLISKLPITVSVNRSSVDYCGILPQPLKNDKMEAQAGWKNGEISYIPGADWIAFFFGGETESASYGKNQHIVGKVDDLAALKKWPQGFIKVRIELFKI